MPSFDDTLPTEDRWRISERLNSLAPKSWGEVRLGDVANIQNGAPFASGLFNKDGNGLPLIRIRDVGENSPDTFYSGPYEPEYLVESGAILVGMDGEFRCRKWSGPVGLLNQRVCRIRFTSRLIDEGFAFAILQLYLSAVEAVTSSITVKHLSSKTVADLRLLLPPLNEQRRIVAKLEALQARSDAAKAALDAIPPLLEQFRQSVLAAAFRGDLSKAWREAHPDVEPASVLLERIRAERRRKWQEANPRKAYVEPAPVDTAGLPELPAGWCWARAEELAWEITVGHVGPMMHRYVASGVPFLRSQNVRANRFDPAGLLYIDEAFHKELRKSVLNPGDLLVVRSGAPGTACVLPEEVGQANCADLVITRLLPGIAPSLVAFFVNSDFARSQVHDAQVGVAQQHFNVGAMKEMVIPIMSELEQEVLLTRLAEGFESIGGLGNVAQDAASKLAILKQSILAKAFRGELVPQDPSDEPASVLLERIRRERAAGAERGGGKQGRGKVAG